MRTTKTLLGVALALAVTVAAQAAQYETKTLFSVTSINTNAAQTVAAGASTNHPTAITLTKDWDVTIAVGYYITNAVTAGDAMCLTLKRGLDGTATTKESTPTGTCLMTPSAAGTATVGVTNVPASWLGSAGYLYVGLTIPTNAPCTNVWVKYTFKPTRRE
jgi:hypothetical protein